MFSGIDNTKRKKKIKKGTKSSSESEDDKKPKKKRKVSASDPVGKEVKKRKATKATTAAVVKSEFFSEENLSDIDTKPAPATVAKKNKSNFNILVFFRSYIFIFAWCIENSDCEFFNCLMIRIGSLSIRSYQQLTIV